MVKYGNKCFVRFEALIAEGKHTSNEIITILIEEFPDNSETAIKMLVLDSTWSEHRHRKLSRLILKHHETNVLSFC
jgi:putative N-acetylmannosamine-6-phosphate epimerase